VDEKLIGQNAPLDDALAEAVARRHEHEVTVARVGIQGEEDACAREVRANHLLDPDRERDLRVGEAHVEPVADRAGREEARECLADCLSDEVRASDVEEALLLAGKARGREVLGCRG
jgi:hypothetical protein